MGPGAFWLILWAPAAVIALLWRRDRRLAYFAPSAGAALLFAGLTLSALGWLNPSGLAAITAISGVGAFPLLAAWVRAYVRRDLPAFAAGLRRSSGWVAGCLVLAFLAACGYYLLGRAIAQRWGFRDDLTLFDSDAPRYLRLIAGGVGETPVVHKHPAYVLLAGSMMRVLRAAGREAPLLVNAAAGAVAVLLATVYFRRITGSRTLAVLLGAGLGISAGHLVFGAIPETYAWSAMGLALMHLVLAGCKGRALAGAGRQEVVRSRHVVPAAVLAIGVTVTHLVPASFCYALGRRGWWRWRRFRFWLAAVATNLALLVALQNAFFASASGLPDLRPGLLAAEKRYLTEPRVGVVPEALVNVFRGVFAESVAGSWPRPGRDRDGRAGVQLGAYSGALSRICVAFWWLLLAGSAAAVVMKASARGPTLVAVVLGLAFAIALHIFYGNRHVFLFACTFTFYLFALVAHGLRVLPHRPAVLGLAVWIGLCALNNGRFCARLLELLWIVGRFGAGVC
jgi:hypothetical protein